MCKNNSPIAVIDSGVGGISVLKELIRLMPNENYIYFGDNKNAPYGNKTTDEVRNLMFSNVSMLLEKGAKAIVIACNTATGASVEVLREKYPDISIIGIEPAIKPTIKYKEHSNVLVMATPLTLKQDKFCELLYRFCDDVNIMTLACPGLMDLIEAGKTSGKELEDFLKKLFSEIEGIKFDSVVLGCTHYPHIKETIKKVIGYDVMIFDGGEGTARETKRRLMEKDLLNDCKEKGTLEILCSSKENNISNLALELLQK